MFYDHDKYTIQFSIQEKISNFITTYNYLCIISILDKVTKNELYVLKITDIDLLKFLDHVYYTIQNNMDTNYFFYNTNSSNVYNGIYLFHGYDLNGNVYFRLSILEFNKEKDLCQTMMKLDFKNSKIYDFLDLLYEYFIFNMNNPMIHNIQDELLSDEFTNLFLGYEEEII